MAVNQGVNILFKIPREPIIATELMTSHSAHPQLRTWSSPIES